MTPLICKLLLGAIVPVDAVGVAISTVQVQKPIHHARTSLTHALHARPYACTPVFIAHSFLQVVLVPIIVGMLANAKFPKTVKKIEPFSPVVRACV